jgi:catechol 2,3-dioxygenase-like lactoylglutathione lyase family enzyme
MILLLSPTARTSYHRTPENRSGGRHVLMRLDHLVILVPDLEEAVEDYGRLGFRVAPGGEHADSLTRNALVPFRDGTYLELVSFLDDKGARDNVWGWRGFLPRGGLVDYCAASDGLLEDVRRLRRLGFEVDGPTGGGRRLPDGEEIRWRSASVSQEGRTLPFLIEDVTPRDCRVPAGPATDHPNGVTGILRLEISAHDTLKTHENLAVLTGSAPGSPKLGSCGLIVIRQENAGRQGPAVARLSTDTQQNAGEPDQRLARGFRFTLSPEAES